MSEENTHTYKPLTYKMLEDMLKDLEYCKPSPTPFIVHTGYMGMKIFDLIMMFKAAEVKGNFSINYFFSEEPRSRNKSFDILKPTEKLGFIYLSLVEKSGLYKLRFYYKNKFPLHLYKGTELVCITNNLESINKRLKK